MMTRIFTPLLILVFFASSSAIANSRRPGEIAGPVEADILKVIDGDTIFVLARPWPQQAVEVYVRLRGIDAPEMKSACSPIRRAGQEAREALNRLVGDQRIVLLMRISGDKYFGRVLADVVLKDGRNPAQELLASGYVAAYPKRKETSQSCDYWQ